MWMGNLQRTVIDLCSVVWDQDLLLWPGNQLIRWGWHSPWWSYHKAIPKLLLATEPERNHKELAWVPKPERTMLNPASNKPSARTQFEHGILVDLLHLGPAWPIGAFSALLLLEKMSSLSKGSFFLLDLTLRYLSPSSSMRISSLLGWGIDGTECDSLIWEKPAMSVRVSSLPERLLVSTLCGLTLIQVGPYKKLVVKTVNSWIRYLGSNLLTFWFWGKMSMPVNVWHCEA